jgi:hypothetical protein
MVPVPVRRRRRGRRVLAVLACLTVAVVATVALAPALVNRGLFQGTLRRAIEAHIRGSVHLGTLRLGWFGPQSVEGFAVTDASGRRVAQLDVKVSAGLLGLLRGAGPLQIDLSGTLDGDVRESGTTSFEELLAVPAPGPARGAAAPGARRSALSGVPATTVKVTGLDLRLRDPQGRHVSVEGLHGELVYAPGDRVALDLAGSTTGGSTRGSIAIAGAVRGLFDAGGALTLDRGSGRIDVTLRDVPVPLSDVPAELDSLALAVSSAGLSGRVEVTVKAEAAVEGAAGGVLEGAFVLEAPVASDGSLRGGFELLDRLTGRLTARSMPAAILQRALAPSPVIAARDLGPLLDVDADLSPGAEHRIALAVRAEHLDLQFTGTLDPLGAALEGERLRVQGRVTPGLFAALTGLELDRAADVVLEVEGLSLPAAGGLGDLALRGSLAAAGPSSIGVAGLDRLAVVSGLRVAFETSGLGTRAAASGGADIDGAAMTFELDARDLLDAAGRVSLDRLGGAASLAVRGLSPAVLAALLPGREGLVRAALRDPLEVTVTAHRAGDEATLECAASSPELTLTLKAAREKRDGAPVLRVDEARGSILVTPKLVAALQGPERPVVLGAAARAEIAIEPFTTPEWPGGGPLRRPEALRATLAIAPFAIECPPRLARPLVVRGFQAVIGMGTSAPWALSMDGAAQLLGVHEQGLASARFTAAAEGAQLRAISLRLADLAVDGVESLLGNPAGAPGSLAGWIGKQGTLAIALDGIGTAPQAEVNADFRHLAGTFVARAEGDLIAVAAREPRLSLGREILQARLSPATPRAPGPRGAEPITVEADVPLSLTIAALRVPRALVTGGPFDPAAVECDVALRGGPLVINDPRAGRNQLDNLALAVRSRDLAAGVDLRLDGDLILAGAPRPGKLEVRGLASGLVDARGAFRPQDARLAMTAKAEGMHTAVLDAAAGYRGLLVAAVGPRVDFSAAADDFSRSSGVLAARVDSPNGWLEGKLRGADRALVIDAAEPLRAELAVTPPLRERLLSRIHPLFADIRTTEQPVRASAGASVVPLDGDVSRLESDLEVTVGAVEFDSGSLMLALLALSKTGGKDTLPGSIDPIRARIRKGVVTYDRFAVRIGKYTLVYSGRVDLNTQGVDLRTEIPLEALAGTFHELKGYADDLAVPIVTRGTFGKLKTEIEPKFLADLAAKAGVKQLEKETGVPIGDILDGIFKKKK